MHDYLPVCDAAQEAESLMNFRLPSGKRLGDSYRSHRGETACSNGLRPRLDGLDTEVLTAIEQKALQSEVVREAVRRAIVLIKSRAAKNSDRPAALRRELEQMESPAHLDQLSDKRLNRELIERLRVPEN